MDGILLFYKVALLVLIAFADPEVEGGGQGVRSSPGKSQKYSLFCNTGPTPLENDKATKPAFIVGLSSAGWWADDGQLLVLYRSSVLPSSTKKKNNAVSVNPPLTKLSGSAHIFCYWKKHCYRKVIVNFDCILLVQKFYS